MIIHSQKVYTYHVPGDTSKVFCQGVIKAYNQTDSNRPELITFRTEESEEVSVNDFTARVAKAVQTRNKLEELVKEVASK